jgi:hypothetical protein
MKLHYNDFGMHYGITIIQNYMQKGGTFLHQILYIQTPKYLYIDTKSRRKQKSKKENYWLIG